ncbi:hypothetical protein [Paenirhodobacter populi]|uniref:Uncharacterized protein n=1 Tax=Paenirhodobacter populi TaxID=2306993 RepID=A0A443K812_9RHOB|nr:hypothetical protein [Sinirhodobacter populi]RWR10544.1 hypothetical protein D2T33_12890 [Sinirhodobacter populi]RWR24435.1 hypothetical protein D2T30_00510 [Sinirhodobacter populi]RWR28929.1 hypothetical protein D2T31_12545 [Sinirhodobacter populi]
MTPEERIAAAEQATADTQLAAVKLVTRIMDGYKTPPEARKRIARLLITLSASAPNQAEAQLARLVAAALRKDT